MESAVLILSALFLNALLGGPPQLYRALGLAPLGRLPAAVVLDMERRLNRPHRSATDREMRGVLLVAFVIIAALLTGWVLEWMFLPHLQFLQMVLVAVLLPVRPTWDSVWQIRKHIMAVPAPPDEHAVARQAIEMIAVHFSEKIFAPCLWYFVFGLPGMLASKSVYLLRETLARPGGDEGFSKAARLAHNIFHYIPARVSAVLWLTAAAFLPTAQAGEAAKEMSPSLNRATPMKIALLSASSVLKLGLGGPTSFYLPQEWVGSGTVKAGAQDIKRALFAFALLHLVLFVLFGLFL